VTVPTPPQNEIVAKELTPCVVNNERE